MNADILLGHYARIADAPDAIARLRRFVLDLAVRGKLVEQDTGDEPASELLKRIAAENLEASVRGLDKALRTKREDLPFTPPKHWEWAKLIAFSEASYGFAFASNRFNSNKVGMPLIRIRDISGTDTEAYFEGEYDPWYVVKTGDYLVGMDGDFNLRRWRGGDALLNQRVLRLNGWHCGIEPEFVRLPLQMTLDHLHGGTSQTTVKHLSAKQVNGIEIPLPPRAEQHRIVAKVDELMALCDQLEAAQVEREAARDTFALSTLARLNTPDPETFGDDSRFALANLAPLTTRPGQIKQLRQTILNLAVLGKLVEQNPADEIAEVPPLRQFSAASGIDPAVFEKFSKTIALPRGWQVAPLAQLSENIVDCPHTTPKWKEQGEICIRTNQLRPGALDLSAPRYVSPEEYVERVERLEPIAEDILYSREGGILGIACRVPPSIRLCLGQRLMLIRAGAQTRPDFLEMVLNSPFITSIAKACTTGGAAPRVNMSTVRAYPIPLPPLAEQHRIVAKVDELMALCDQLEASITTGEQTRSRLLEAVLHNALEPA